MYTRITSAFMKLNGYDFLKAFFMAVISAVLNFIYPTLVLHMLPDWQSTAYVAAIAAVGYLIKNLFTPAAKIYPAPDQG